MYVRGVVPLLLAAKSTPGCWKNWASDGGWGGWGGGGVKYRMLHIPGILDCTYHLRVSCLCAQGSSIAEYLDYSP